MGIHGLTKFLSEKAPNALQQVPPASLMGRTIAVDASQSLYQFMVAIRDAQDYGNLTNSEGVTTSHLAGMLSRAVRILELGIKPIYVFDGKPPMLKSGELAKRKDRKAVAEEGLDKAIEEGREEEIKKFAGRTVRVTSQHNADVQKLLKLMGIPIFLAPGEAEAQCAEFCKSGLVYGTGSEDADSLCFGTEVLIRHLTFSDAKAKTAQGSQLLIMRLSTILKELSMTMDQFIDFCILLGCDYCESIKNLGPVSAFKLIKEFKSIEKGLASLDSGRYKIPETYPFEDARRLFTKPDVVPAEELNKQYKSIEFGEIDEPGLMEFLVKQNQFSQTRVENAIARLKKARNAGSQKRIDSFFKLKPPAPPPPALPIAGKAETTASSPDDAGQSQSDLSQSESAATNKAQPRKGKTPAAKKRASNRGSTAGTAKRLKVE